MASVHVTRETPKPLPSPAIKDVVLTLSFEEACALRLTLGHIAGRGVRLITDNIGDVLQLALPKATNEALNGVREVFRENRYMTSGFGITFTDDSLVRLRAAIGEKP